MEIKKKCFSVHFGVFQCHFSGVSIPFWFCNPAPPISLLQHPSFDKNATKMPFQATLKKIKQEK